MLSVDAVEIFPNAYLNFSGASPRKQQTGQALQFLNNSSLLIELMRKDWPVFEDEWEAYQQRTPPSSLE